MILTQKQRETFLAILLEGTVNLPVSVEERAGFILYALDKIALVGEAGEGEWRPGADEAAIREVIDGWGPGPANAADEYTAAAVAIERARDRRTVEEVPMSFAAPYNPATSRCPSCTLPIGAPGVHEGVVYSRCDVEWPNPCGRYRAAPRYADMDPTWDRDRDGAGEGDQPEPPPRPWRGPPGAYADCPYAASGEGCRTTRACADAGRCLAVADPFGRLSSPAEPVGLPWCECPDRDSCALFTGGEAPANVRCRRAA